MQKPTPGSTYTVVKGDTLWDISGAAYGNPREWKRIYDANKSKLRNPKIYSTAEYMYVVYIFPGEVLFIPGDEVNNKLSSSLLKQGEFDKDQNIRIIINGNEVPLKAAKITLAIDTLSDAFSFSTDTDSVLYNPYIIPFGYESCEVYIDDTKLIDGCIFEGDLVSQALEGETASFIGYSKTKHLIDSSPEPPYVHRNKTLSDIINELGKPFSVKSNNTISENDKFKKVKIEPKEKIGDFLLKLAYQRKVLLRSNTDNEIEIFRAKTNGSPLITIDDDSQFVDPVRFKYKGDLRFQKYISTGKRPKGSIKGIFIDPNINVHRVFCEKFHDSDADEIKKPAEWLYRKALADSIDIGFSVDSFYSDNGELYRENEIVSIKKKTLFLEPGMDLLIRSIDFEQDNSGVKTSFGLTMPTIFTEGDVEEEW